jgi:hypothetical protein
LLSRIVLQQRFITFRVKAMPADKWLGLTDKLWSGKSHIVLTIIITRSKNHIQTQSEMYSFGWNMSKWRPGKFRKYCHLAFFNCVV